MEKGKQKTEETKLGLHGMLVLILMFGLIIGLIVLTSWYFSLPHEDEPEYLQEIIDNKTNVSNEYRLGWEQCIKALINYRVRVTNVTTA